VKNLLRRKEVRQLSLPTLSSVFLKIQGKRRREIFLVGTKNQT
jgi:hypothetical protein